MRLYLSDNVEDLLKIFVTYIMEGKKNNLWDCKFDKQILCVCVEIEWDVEPQEDKEAGGCCTTVLMRQWSIIHNSDRRIRPPCVERKLVCLWFFSRDAGWECICHSKRSLSWLRLDIANQQGGNWEDSRKALEIRAYRWNPEHVFVIVSHCLCHGKRNAPLFV